MRNTTSTTRALLLSTAITSLCLTGTLSWQPPSLFRKFPPSKSRALVPFPPNHALAIRVQRRIQLQRHHSKHGNNGDDGDNASTLITGMKTNSSSQESAVLAAVLGSPEELQRLQDENEQLRESLYKAEIENDRLQHEVSNGLILETFEGESKLNMEDAALWCDELEEDACPVEPTISFNEALRDRAYWLVGLLVLQSCSGIILARNEALLANHPVIIYFLTMLVGAGGNAGNQASVRVIRGLALGTLNEQTQMQFLTREFKMATCLSAILSVAGFVRAIAFRTPLPETIAVTTALTIIVFTSVCLGAVLPLLLKAVGVDPAHSSTSIQVVMDILGVVLAVAVSSLLLDSPVGTMLISRLTGAWA